MSDDYKRPEPVRYWRGNAPKPNTFISGRLLFEQDTGDVYLQYTDESNGNEVTRKLTDTSKVNRSGDVFTGPVILASQPEDVSTYIDQNNTGWNKALIAATKQYVDNVINDLNNHVSNKDIHITAYEREAWNNKVDKKDGYGLSKNDFTDAYKTKLDGISVEATKTSFVQALKAGVLLGTITIDNVSYGIYAPEIKDIDGNSATTTKLKMARSINGILFDGTKNVACFGSCHLKSGTTNKWEVTLDDFDPSLLTGSMIFVRFDAANGEASPTLQVNSTKEAPIIYKGANLGKDDIQQGALIAMVYDGQNYNVVGSSIGCVDYSYKPIIDSMKQKLDGLNNYVLNPATSTTLGGVSIGSGISVTSSGQISITKANIYNVLGIDTNSSILTDKSFTQGVILPLVPVMAGATDNTYNDDGSIKTQGTNGSKGLVPMPVAGQAGYVLYGDGTWKAPSSSAIMVGATSTANGTPGLVPMPTPDDAKKVLLGDGTWGDVTPLISTLSVDDVKAICS
jgi:hypothetical protein